MFEMLNMKPRLLLLLLTLAPSTVARADRVPDGNYEKVVKPFFAAHCLKCHGATKPKGDLRLDNLPLDFVNSKNATHWTDILDRMNSGAMPPAGSPRPN